MFVCKNINKVFNDGQNKNHILKNINIELKEGESLAVTGASGSGKSTLLHIASGLEVACSGEIVIDNVKMSQLKDYEQSKFRLEKIGFIYQFHHLIKELNVFENISLPLLLQNMKKDEVFGCVNDIIDNIGLSKRKYFQIDKLSGGERQRVAIARAIINQPKIIFADEPTGNLDNKNAKNIFSLLNDLAKINDTVLMVATHDDQLTQMLDKKIAIISGEIKSL